MSQYVALRKAEQAAADQHDAQLTAGLRIVNPPVRWLKAPLKPQQMPKADRSVLLGRSAFMAPGDGKGDVEPVYEPLEDGGFRIAGGKRRFNRPIVHGQNRVWTGDVPTFHMDTALGLGSYAGDERVFPLWPRPNAQIGDVRPSMGTLRLGVKTADGKTQWMDELGDVTAMIRPGYTEYQLADVKAGWKASLTVAPALDFHGFVCRVEFDKEMPLVWQYGGVFWLASEANANRVEIRGPRHASRSPICPTAWYWPVGTDKARAAPWPAPPVNWPSSPPPKPAGFITSWPRGA